MGMLQMPEKVFRKAQRWDKDRHTHTHTSTNHLLYLQLLP